MGMSTRRAWRQKARKLCRIGAGVRGTPEFSGVSRKDLRCLLSVTCAAFAQPLTKQFTMGNHSFPKRPTIESDICSLLVLHQRKRELPQTTLNAHASLPPWQSTTYPLSPPPGTVLGPVTKLAPGPGTHVHDGSVVASLMGKVAVEPAATAPGPAKRLNKLTATQPATDGRATVSVARHGGRPARDLARCGQRGARPRGAPHA